MLGNLVLLFVNTFLFVVYLIFICAELFLFICNLFVYHAYPILFIDDILLYFVEYICSFVLFILLIAH